MTYKVIISDSAFKDLEIEFEQKNGASYYSLNELDIALKKIIK